ncbi:hypothetical protein AB205_0098230 [Aquarana catesbeiana]|uniref:Uncharacterized protein n=1 Tax=Aquarana catesbeiana TaxID=8400 RepID=A0A2G9QK07_AQUCT|nr:hypothetical protein AB205_0098230 [Aquarana catesbeiana]
MELCPAPTAASVELQGTSPAEALAKGQRVQGLCLTSVAVPEAQGEKVAVTSQQQIRIQGEKVEEVFIVPPQQSARVEEAVFPPQQRSVHLGDSTIDMSSQQPDEGMEKEAVGSSPQWQLHSLEMEESSLLPQRLAGVEDVECPAEVLATGQSATNLCPAPATTVEFQGAGAVGPSLQRQADVVKLLLPAESLATGQSVAGLCLPPTVSLQLQEAGVIGPSAQQQTKPRNVKNHAAEALAAGQRVNDLCPHQLMIIIPFSQEWRSCGQTICPPRRDHPTHRRKMVAQAFIHHSPQHLPAPSCRKYGLRWSHQDSSIIYSISRRFEKS